MKHIVIYLFLGITLFASCKDFLEVEPVDALPEEDTYRNYSDFKKHYRGVYSSMKGAGGFTEACRIYGDIQCDLAQAVMGNSNLLQLLYSWNFNSLSGETSSIYNAMWQTIGRCNNLFDHMDLFRQRVHGRDSINMEGMLGDIYFIRALCYSELVKYYCEAYDETRSTQQLGMPVCTTQHVKNPPRESLDSTYNFMYADLAEAEKRMYHLSFSDISLRLNFLFTYECMQALKARLALYQGKWELAAAESEAVLEYCLGLGMKLGNQEAYAGLFLGEDYSPEVLFFLGMHPEDVQGHMGTYFIQQNGNDGGVLPEYIPSETLLNAFNPDDLRFGVIFAEAQTGYNHGLVAYLLRKDSKNPSLDKSAANSNYQTMPKLFRLSELYLISIEANARIAANLPVAQKRLAEFWQARREGFNERTVDMNAEEILETVKRERICELCFEGFRLADLKRYKEGINRKPMALTVSPANALIKTYDDPRFVWPIPRHELDVNPNMLPNASN